MAKNRVKVVKSRGSVPVASGGFQYVLGENQTQEEYRSLLDKTNTRFAEAEKDFVASTARRLLMMWEAGTDWQAFLSKKRNARGQITDADLSSVAQDLEPFKTGQRVTTEVIRMCLRVSESYPQERVKELADLGINENHISVFLQLEDTRARRQLETRVIKEHLTGDQARKLVQAMAKDPAQAAMLRPNSRSRYKQEAAKRQGDRKSRTDKPAAMIQHVMDRFEIGADDLTDLFTSLARVKELEPADRAALVEPLDRLLTKINELISTLAGIKNGAMAAMCEAKQALAQENKTQGVKGADTGKKPKNEAK